MSAIFPLTPDISTLVFIFDQFYLALSKQNLCVKNMICMFEIKMKIPSPSGRFVTSFVDGWAYHTIVFTASDFPFSLWTVYNIRF